MIHASQPPKRTLISAEKVEDYLVFEKLVHNGNGKRFIFNTICRQMTYDTNFFIYTELPTDYAEKYMKW